MMSHSKQKFYLNAQEMGWWVDSTVEHVLLHCASFTNARDDLFRVTLTTMSKLFSKVASRLIISFVKVSGFYRKI